MHYQRWRKTGDPLKVKINYGNRKPRPVLTERTCRYCGMTGPVSLFLPKRNQCRPCRNAYRDQWNRRNPDKVQAYLAHGEARRQRYERRRQATRNGQDPDFIEAYLAEHDGRCEICGRKPQHGERALHIDHDHRTGMFRGMICNNCNGGIGRFQDNPEFLIAAADYLRSRVTPEALANLITARHLEHK